MTTIGGGPARLAGFVSLVCMLGAAAAGAQYAETPRVLAAVDQVESAAQIGRRLFVAGFINEVRMPETGAVVVDAAGALVPGGFPAIDGSVDEIVADGAGGWVVVGGFRQVDGQPFGNIARIGPDRAVDTRYRVSADGPIRRVAMAHGRAYLLGDFTEINGSPRMGLAALDVATGALSTWGSAFDPGLDSFTGLPRRLRNLSVSPIGVYVSGGGDGNRFPASAPAGRLWGLDAATGAPLFERTAFVTAIAATSARVFLGGYRQPALVALDPLTGATLPWSPGLAFQNVGSQEPRITALMADGSRLYAGGFFQTPDGQRMLVALDAATGQPSAWRPSQPPTSAGEVSSLTRLGPALVSLQGGVLKAYDVGTGAELPWTPQPSGFVATVAPAPEGAVLGGGFRSGAGAPRSALVSFDLDSGELEPWTSALPDSTVLERLATDGTALFGATNGGQFFKIDPETGAVLGALDFGGAFLVAERLVGDRIVAVLGDRLGVITTADWSHRTIPLVLAGQAPGAAGFAVQDLEAVGDRAYLAGSFIGVNGASRAFLAAVDLDTGAVQPFDASPDAEVNSVRFVNGRLWVAGRFHRIGGARRRGLAELDPVTGAALAWNPDAPGGAWLDADDDGTLYVSPATTIGGRSRGRLAAFSTSTGQWLPWRPALGHSLPFIVGSPVQRKPVFLAGCLVPTAASTVACYPEALPSPAAPTVQQAGSQVTLSWTLPAGPVTWAGLHVEVGEREGTSDVASILLPPDATSVSSPIPRGSYFARVRTIGPSSASVPTEDVSFAVGPPGVPPAPIDPVAVTEAGLVTILWRAPSTGAPAAYRLDAEQAGRTTRVASLLVSGGASSATVAAAPGRYRARLTALNVSGASAPSSELAIDVETMSPPCYNTPPLAPSDLAATVAGRSVTLTWTPAGAGPGATMQGVVAGSAPGLDNLGVFTVAGTAASLTMTVPPGTYYARVIAQNACGLSGFSNEVQVVVP